MKARYLIDTVVFVWALRTPERLSRAARRVFARDGVELELSAASLTEIGIKHSCGKLQLDRSSTVEGIAALRLRVLPLREAHALEMFGLPLHHKDPFDRMIVAQALCEGVPVVTADEAFRMYRGVEVIW